MVMVLVKGNPSYEYELVHIWRLTMVTENRKTMLYDLGEIVNKGDNRHVMDT